uniref:Uncharacterized protein n=1 Tax=Spironucleus salmonicida TaxID=348837 RepID=V6LTP5_9EUKA|eukprot:EST48022.1 Hypothetical protein SS50377_ja059 [Spironucleus salmonicida]
MLSRSNYALRLAASVPVLLGCHIARYSFAHRQKTPSYQLILFRNTNQQSEVREVILHVSQLRKNLFRLLSAGQGLRNGQAFRQIFSRHKIPFETSYQLNVKYLELYVIEYTFYYNFIEVYTQNYFRYIVFILLSSPSLDQKFNLRQSAFQPRFDQAEWNDWMPTIIEVIVLDGKVNKYIVSSIYFRCQTLNKLQRFITSWDRNIYQILMLAHNQHLLPTLTIWLPTSPALAEFCKSPRPGPHLPYCGGHAWPLRWPWMGDSGQPRVQRLRPSIQTGQAAPPRIPFCHSSCRRSRMVAAAACWKSGRGWYRKTTRWQKSPMRVMMSWFRLVPRSRNRVWEDVFTSSACAAQHATAWESTSSPKSWTRSGLEFCTLKTHTRSPTCTRTRRRNWWSESSIPAGSREYYAQHIQFTPRAGMREATAAVVPAGRGRLTKQLTPKTGRRRTAPARGPSRPRSWATAGPAPWPGRAAPRRAGGPRGAACSTRCAAAAWSCRGGPCCQSGRSRRRRPLPRRRVPGFCRRTIRLSAFGEWRRPRKLFPDGGRVSDCNVETKWLEQGYRQFLTFKYAQKSGILCVLGRFQIGRSRSGIFRRMGLVEAEPALQMLGDQQGTGPIRGIEITPKPKTKFTAVSGSTRAVRLG